MATRKRTVNRSVVGATSLPSSSEIDKIAKELRKKFGEKTIRKGTDAVQPWRIPTGIFELDLALCGGIPQDRMTMIHGPKHAGKSYTSDRVIMGAQQTMPGQKVVKLDIEGTHDEVWSSKTGVDNDELILVQPDSGEQAIDIAVAMVHAKEVSLIVVDSLAALVPIKEQEEDADKALVALQSRLITRMLRLISAAQITERKRGHHVTVLLLNQQRTKIGGWSPSGDPISLPGGKALGHFTSVEIRLKNKENKSKDDKGRETLSHNDHAFAIEKNKLNAGIRDGEFRMLRRDDPSLGLSEAEIDDAAVMLSYAKMNGWHSGTPKGGYTLQFGEYDELRTDSVDDMISTLYADRDYYWALRGHLIAEHARQLGMPDWFQRYLTTGEADHE